MVLKNLNPLKRTKIKKMNFLKEEIKRRTGLNIFKNLAILSTTQASCRGTNITPRLIGAPLLFLT
jgi:hypothetical protein